MHVSLKNGGVQELIATGNAVACFQVMSNELATPKILICPQDNEHDYATNFGTSFTRSNLSYFIALNAAETDPQAILSGDDNLLVNSQPVSPGILNPGTNTITWSPDRHHNTGNLLISDGSVQSTTDNGLKTYLQNATNNVVIP
jgi:hypothetical protein